MMTVKLFASRAMEGKPPMGGPLQLTIKATYLHPQSWSKAQKAKTSRKTSKPDLSNIIKIVEDSIKAVVWIDDAQVAHVVAEKIYGPRAEVQVFVSQLVH
jgi:Holliday junction resolvase RusA-like endonuclease